MTFIDQLFDSLNAPGPNQRWLECNGNVARKGYEEMIAERDLAMPSAPAVAASPSNRFAFRPSGLPSVSQEKSACLTK